MTQFDDQSWMLRFRFLRRYELNGVYIHDESITWGNAMTMAFRNKIQGHEGSSSLDYADFHNEMLRNYFSLRACGVIIPEQIETLALSEYSDVFTRVPYTKEVLLDIPLTSLCKNVLSAMSMDKESLMEFVNSLDGSLVRIQSFIAGNCSEPYFSLDAREQLPDRTSHDGIPSEILEPYYPYPEAR